jgi:exonuclease VII large subunit
VIRAYDEAGNVIETHEQTLRHGYSITMNDRGQIIWTTAVVKPKMKIRTRVSDGEFGSEAQCLRL